MPFQVLVKTAQHMLGSYSFLLEDEVSAREFVRRPDVWWYSFSSDEDWEWHKGGAWAGAEHLADAAGVKPPGPAPAEAYPLPLENEDEDEEDEDARW